MPPSDVLFVTATCCLLFVYHLSQSELTASKQRAHSAAWRTKYCYYSSKSRSLSLLHYMALCQHIINGLRRNSLATTLTRDVINPVANEDVRKLRAFLVNQQQFPHWRPHLPVTF